MAAMLGPQPIFQIRADLAAITDLGRTPYGQRRIIDILGGTVKGDRLNGRVLPGGADWQIIRNDGAADIQARYTIQTETGARILVSSNGLRHGPPEVLERLTRGEDVEPSLSIIELRRGDRVLLCSDGLHGLVGDPALALLMSAPHTVGESVMLLITAARAAGGSDNITAVVADVAGERLQPPRDEHDLPTFMEFDPQKEGDPALTDTSYVARRLAAKIGLPTHSIPPSIPVTG